MTYDEASSRNRNENILSTRAQHVLMLIFGNDPFGARTFDGQRNEKSIIRVAEYLNKKVIRPACVLDGIILFFE